MVLQGWKFLFPRTRVARMTGTSNLHHQKAAHSNAMPTTNPKYTIVNLEEKREKHGKKDTEGNWPTEPRRLREWTTFTYAALCWDVFVTLLPVIFIVLGACAIFLDQRQLSGFGANIRKGNTLGPTIFPVVFAAVVARLMKGIALRRAEQGTHLGLLEQLTGSQSLAGAIERTVMLRRFGVIGTAIILLWLLSPLGGQSSLRILEITSKIITSPGQIQYFNTTTIGSTESTFSTGDDYTSFLVSALLQASLLQPDRILNSPIDQWNNVKIPKLDELSSFTDSAPSNPWINVNQTAHTVWSSLTGLMIQQLPNSGISTFTVESSYLDLGCSDSTRIEADSQSAGESYKNYFKNGLQFHNASSPFTCVSMAVPGNNTSSFFMDLSYPPDPEFKGPLNLLYASNLGNRDSSGYFLDLFNCSVATARVESAVTCHGGSCAVNRMRKSERDTRPPFPINKVEYEHMLQFLPFALGIPHDGTVSPIDQYLLGSDAPLEAGGSPIAPNFSGVPGQVFSQRLTTILNTVWQASLAPSCVALGAAAKFNADEGGSCRSTSTKTTVTREISVYAAKYLFIGLLLVISIVLQLCAIVGLVLKYTASAPDILGYVSTMTIDNPHTKVPCGGNTLDGLERARYLHTMKVQLADVNWNQAQGHLVFRNVDDDTDFAEGKLSKKKLYV